MTRGVIVLALFLSFLVSGCSIERAPASAADSPIFEGISGYAWGTDIAQIPGLELMGGASVNDGVSDVEEISTYFRPGDASPYTGVTVYDIKYIFCEVPAKVRVVLCGAVLEYGSEEYRRVIDDTEVVESTNHRRLVSQLVSQGGMPLVRRIVKAGQTEPVAISTVVPFSENDVMRYTWCWPHRRSVGPLGRKTCAPRVVVAFDPRRGEGYALFVSELLLNAVDQIQYNSSVVYPLFESVYGPDRDEKASGYLVGSHLFQEYLAVTSVCAQSLDSERALRHASKSRSEPLASSHHPIAEREYQRLLSYSKFQSHATLFQPSAQTSAAAEGYLAGYSLGVMYAYHEGRWRGAAFNDKWMQIADSGDDWLSLEGRGYRDGARLLSPQLSLVDGFDASRFERYRSRPAADWECRRV